MKAHILLCNDDGIHAEGIRHLFDALKEDFRVSIVAPHKECSGFGMKITLEEAIEAEEVSWPGAEIAYAVKGSPADCVKMGISVLIKEKIDYVVSGINKGNNSARNYFYSGTVSNCVEGTFHGIPSIAFSCMDWISPNFESAKSVVMPVMRHVQENPLPTDVLLNVNIPNGPLKGIRFASQGLEFIKEDPIRSATSNGSIKYNLGFEYAFFSEKPSADVEIMKEDYAAVVPIQVHDNTAYDYLRKFEELDLLTNSQGKLIQ